MNIVLSENKRSAARQSGFTLVEVACGAVIMSVMFASLYLGLSQGFAVVQMGRENLRATQILQEQTEILRLYTWDQINDGKTIPTNTIWNYDPLRTDQGTAYTGVVSIANADMPDTTYSADHRSLTFTLSWATGNVPRQRQVSTVVSKYGLHNYLYGAN
jgi:prepilin-type N-terminal cleavage/methylation domain-containing protein